MDATSLGHRLEELRALRDEGLLSSEEFDNKRAELVARPLSPSPGRATAHAAARVAAPSPTMRTQTADQGSAKPATTPTSNARGGIGRAVQGSGLALLVSAGAVIYGLVQSPVPEWNAVIAGSGFGAVAFLLALTSPTPGGSKGDQALAIATRGWTTPVLMRSYRNDKSGLAKANAEAEILARHGYHVQGQSAAGGHLNVGRTAARVALTGGLGLLFGGSRTQGSIQVTYERS